MSNNDREQDLLLLVHAYADGELDPANALAVERRIAQDPALAPRVARNVVVKVAGRNTCIKYSVIA